MWHALTRGRSGWVLVFEFLVMLDVAAARPPAPLTVELRYEAPKQMRSANLRFFEGFEVRRDLETYTVSNPYLIIAGQTPGHGIVLKRAQVILIATHDVIVRDLRVRPGTDAPVPYSSQTLTVHDADGKEAHDVIVAHGSLTWSIT